MQAYSKSSVVREASGLEIGSSKDCHGNEYKDQAVDLENARDVRGSERSEQHAAEPQSNTGVWTRVLDTLLGCLFVVALFFWVYVMRFRPNRGGSKK